MDKTIQSISEYAAGERYEFLPREVRSTAVSRLIDTLGCAIGGYQSVQARIARATAPSVSAAGQSVGRIIGDNMLTSSEHAAFANTCMIRSLDFNDFYPASHPSDMLGGLLAAADRPGITGRRLLTGLVVAYEVSARVSDASNMRRKGWDQGYAIGLGTVAGLGNMLGCPVHVIREALAITATANVHLRATRAGQLSLWKGAATAYAVRNAVFGLTIAMEGMTGPEAPVEGRHGLWEQITGAFSLPGFPPKTEYRILQSTLKYWPVEFNAQAAVWAALELRQKATLKDLVSLSIGTYWSSWHEIGSEPAKWDPTTRETADHSMPYIFVKAMQDGHVDLTTFDREAYSDQSIRPEMAKIQVAVDDECDRAWPDHVLLKAVAVTREGVEHRITVKDPRGFWRNPMTQEEVEWKYLGLTVPILGEKQSRAALEYWSNVAEHEDLAPGLEALRIPAELGATGATG